MGHLDTWQDVIDYHLVEIGRNLQHHEASHYPPTKGTVALAITLAEDFDYYNSPPPTEIYVDYYGGIVFSKDVGCRKVVATIFSNGSVEYLGLGFAGGARRRVIPRCKTGEEDYWTLWIKEGEKDDRKSRRKSK